MWAVEQGATGNFIGRIGCPVQKGPGVRSARFTTIASVMLMGVLRRLAHGDTEKQSIASIVAKALGDDQAPDCRLNQVRVTLVFRRLGATSWPEERRIEHALRAAAVVRHELNDHRRREMRRRATRAIEIVYEDASAGRGCAVTARWEYVVPAKASKDIV